MTTPRTAIIRCMSRIHPQRPDHDPAQIAEAWFPIAEGFMRTGGQVAPIAGFYGEKDGVWTEHAIDISELMNGETFEAAQRKRAALITFLKDRAAQLNATAYWCLSETWVLSDEQHPGAAVSFETIPGRREAVTIMVESHGHGPMVFSREIIRTPDGAFASLAPAVASPQASGRLFGILTPPNDARGKEAMH